jgi:hypothetical protein
MANHIAANYEKDSLTPYGSEIVVHCEAVTWHANELMLLSSSLPAVPRCQLITGMQDNGGPTHLHDYAKLIEMNLKGHSSITEAAASAHCQAVKWHGVELSRLEGNGSGRIRLDLLMEEAPWMDPRPRPHWPPKVSAADEDYLSQFLGLQLERDGEKDSRQ